MTTFNWSTLTNGQVLTFNPLVDVLFVDDPAISAALMFTILAPDIGGDVGFSAAGKQISLTSSVGTLTTANFTFADGSLFLAGDNSTGTANDALGNTLVGGNGNDRLNGLGGNDSLVGGAGNDFFFGYGLYGPFGADTIDGGIGTDTLNFAQDNAGPAATVNLATGTASSSQGTITLISIENVNGSFFNDSITGDNLANFLSGRSGDDTLNGGLGDDTLSGGTGNDTLNGGGGTQDVADYSVASLALGGVTVNLVTGSATGADGNDTLIDMEYVFGSNSADVITGNSARNFIRGNLGNDTLDGGGESDIEIGQVAAAGDYADYRGATGAVTVNLTTGTATGADGNDSLVNFESVRGSNFADLLVGNAGNNWLRGGTGNDTMDGGAGSLDIADYRNASGSVTVNLATNTSSGADGVDALSNFEGIQGGDSADILTGDGGNNWFYGRLGNDTINGGAGYDFASYLTSGSSVTVSLVTGTSSGGNSIDSLVSIEAVEGSDFNDTLTGDNTQGIGNDILGMAGNDLLRVTLGDDLLDGGDGSDTIDFTQTGITYVGAIAVNVNLATHVADVNRSAAGLDTTLASIETVFGTAGDDIFVGGDAANEFDSKGDRPTERFRGGAGSDTINGGANHFTVADYAGNLVGQSVSANLFTTFATDGLGGTDKLLNVDGLRGGAGNDLLVGGSLSRTGSGTFFESLRGNAGNDTLDGGNANSGGADGSGDRADYSTSTSGVNVNLGTGIATDGFGGIDTLIDIDAVYGGTAADTLTGGAGNDDLDGGAGNDTLDGAAGSDTARYQQSTAAVVVNLSSSTIFANGIEVAAGTASDGLGGIDTLISMESVRGSDFSDYIRGSDDVATRQFLSGDAGNDTLDGGAGVDIANYSNIALLFGGINATIANGSGSVNDRLGGTDTLINIEGLAGTHTNDTLSGGAGEQWFRGNGGSDSINGGADNDWVFYSTDPTGVTINLGTGTATDGWNGGGGLLALGGTDTLISIENAEGSSYDDSIVGTSGTNELRGRAGNDGFSGLGGDDTIDGGSGSDTAFYSGSSSQYAYINHQGILRIADRVNGRDGVDQLIGVEQAQFVNGGQTLNNINSFISLEYVASHNDLIGVFGANAQAGYDHFVNAGRFENRQVTFNASEYIASYADLMGAFGANEEAGAAHYIASGRLEGRAASFNALEYIASYADLSGALGAKDDAGAFHFINSGRFEGRQATFNALEYIASYGDLSGVFGANEDAGATHYITAGRLEGRQSTFSGLEYIASYGDLSGVFGANEDAGATHYITAGRLEGRQSTFKALEYIASYGDLIGAFGVNADAGSTHYINSGRLEGRTENFDAAQYLANYADLQAVFGTNQEAATIHFITSGYYEGRTD